MSKQHKGLIYFEVDHGGRVSHALVPCFERWRLERGIIRGEDNHEFKAEMVFDGFSRGRSAAHARYVSKDGQRAGDIFLMHLAEIIKLGVPLDRVSGTWTYAKRGKSYGIRLVKDDDTMPTLPAPTQ